MDRYDYSAVTTETVRQAVGEGLAEAERLVALAVESIGSPTFANTLVPLSDAAAAVRRADGRAGRMSLVHPDPGIRDAANAAQEQTEKWREALPQREDVASAVRAFTATAEAADLFGARRRVLDLWLRDLRRTGHELEPSARAELTSLRERIVELVVTFERRLGDCTDALELAADDLAGLSAAFVAQLPDGATAGAKSLPIVESTVTTFLEQSSRRGLRERALRKLLNLAAEENRPIVEELSVLRRRVAALMGASSWSQFANEARMSGGADAVRSFLDRILPPLQATAADERAAMQALLEADGIDDRLQAWDWRYYHERERRALGVDSSALSAYLPLEAVLAGLFDIVRDVFGVDVAEDPSVLAWHPDVRLVVLRDVATGERLADCYLDLFARKGKTVGGITFWLEPGSNRSGSTRRPPVLSVALDFTPAAGGTAPLLQHGNVVGLFHEFGHVLEFGLQRAEVFEAARSWYELDFAEAPSQIMEHWAWAPEALRRFARHHETGEPPPEALLGRLAESRRLNIATSTLWRSGSLAVLDQLLHGREPMDPSDAYRDAFAVTGFPFLVGTFRPASFVHLVDYDAGFYSYLWAQVFGDDMFSAFTSEGLLSADIGRRYRAAVLEPTWTVPGRDRVRNFLGREPSDEAFLERLGIAGRG